MEMINSYFHLQNSFPVHDLYQFGNISEYYQQLMAPPADANDLKFTMKLKTLPFEREKILDIHWFGKFTMNQ
jgi:hypothetical protein